MNTEQKFSGEKGKSLTNLKLLSWSWTCLFTCNALWNKCMFRDCIENQKISAIYFHWSHEIAFGKKHTIAHLFYFTSSYAPSLIELFSLMLRNYIWGRTAVHIFLHKISHSAVFGEVRNQFVDAYSRPCDFAQLEKFELDQKELLSLYVLKLQSKL